MICIVAGLARADSIGGGNVSLEFPPSDGMTIDIGGVPLSRGSTLQIFAPDWKKGYFASIGTRPEVKVDSARRQIDATYHAEKIIQFDASESIRFVNDHRIEITLDGTLGTNVPAKMEWAIGYLNAFAMYGGGYTAGDADAKMTAVSSRAPQSGNKAVIEGASSITLVSLVGRAVVKMEQGGGKLSLLDGRLDRDAWWEADQPSFWLGCLGEDVPVGKPFHYLVSIEFTSTAPPTTAPAREAALKSEAIADAIVPQSSTVQIIPKPKKLTWNDGAFALDPKMNLQSQADVAKAGVNAIKKEVRERFGWEWTSVEDSSPTITFEQDKTLPAEGYRIECSPKSLQISAGDVRGFFSAAQTFAQLVTIKPDGVSIPACSIDDWPTLAFRGVHLFPGKGAMDLHRKLIERIFGRFKFNYLVLECDFSQWDTDPKIWTDISISKDELRQYVKMVRENQIEPIPLVESLGHAGWMFRNDQNLELAEDPHAGWAYDATNPKSYEFIEKVYDEAIDIFHPKYFHIGHDEVADRGVYPSRESSKKIGLPKLFTSDVQKLSAYLAAKNIRTMLWGDMLLAKDESNDGGANAGDDANAKSMRAEIAKDAIICDWHYSPAKPQGYKSLKIFKDDGFSDTIACPWFNPQNIYTLADSAHQNHAWGLLQTTWAGYRIDERSVQREFRQFSAYILAAEYAWNAGEAPAPADLPYHADEVFARAMNHQHQPITNQPGRLIDLSAATNLPLTGDPIDLTDMPLDQHFDGVHFKLPDHRAAALFGALGVTRDLPNSITLRIDQPASQIAFLHATLFDAKIGDEVGAYEIHFADGSTGRIALTYGVNIRAFDDPVATMNASTGWSGKATGGQTNTVRLFVWQNPNPKQSIQSITFTTAHPYASPVLLGMTLVN